MNLNYTEGIKYLISVALLAHVAYDFYTNIYLKKIKRKKEPREEINEVIMFSKETGEVKKSNYSRCMVTWSMDRLLHYLSLPRQTLDICLYVLTNMDVTHALIKLRNKGVKIRLIIDADMAFSSGSTVSKLHKHGIPVRWMKSTNIMHHKFCIADGYSKDDVLPFVMAGSLNWTNQALYGNWEDLLITSQATIVDQYKAEFEKLWVLFKPIVM